MVRAQTEEELAMLKEKQAKAQEDFQATEEALVAAGIDFQHPADEQNEEILNRRSKMVEYRAHLSKQEEVKMDDLSPPDQAGPPSHGRVPRQPR